MKTRWTLALTAVVLVMGAFPALAHQGLQAPTKADSAKMKRKADAAAMTPFVTKHQADSLKKVVDGADRQKSDEQVAYPQGGGPFQPGQMPTDPHVPAPGAPQAPEGDSKSEKQEAPKSEPMAPTFRLMGTVCGTGKDLAMFDLGKEYPSMLKVGDAVDPATKVVSIERGHVKLERTVIEIKPLAPSKAEVDAQAAAAAQMGQPSAPAPMQYEKREKKETFDLYAW